MRLIWSALSLRQGIYWYVCRRFRGRLPVFFGHFFQRFQTVDGEAGADGVDAFQPPSSPCFQRFVGVGLQPFFRAKAGLEADLVFVFG
jgi:hypothetical protein